METVTQAEGTASTKVQRQQSGQQGENERPWGWIKPGLQSTVGHEEDFQILGVGWGSSELGPGKGESDTALLTQVMAQRPSRLGDGFALNPQAPGLPPSFRSQAQLGRGGHGVSRAAVPGGWSPFRGQESELKPELPGGEAGPDPGVLGAVPPPLNSTPLHGVGDVTSICSNSNSQELSSHH